MDDSIKIGEFFSGCKILAQCGRGAYGVVYLAENTISQRIVIKVVENTKNSDRELNGLRNYMTVSRLHPGLLQIYHIGQTDSGFYYTMEAADNLGSETSYKPATLGNLMRQGKKFTLLETITIIRDLLQDLSLMHKAGLIHRDIKPDNILFINDRAKLGDPGLVSKFDFRTSIVGTPGFIPPEVFIRNLPLDPQSDLYAIGKVFYCMISGNPPEEYPHLPTTLPIEIRRQVFPVLSRMCNSNPTKRFHSADELLEKLPLSVRGAHFYERYFQAFQDWKALNREHFRFLLGGTAVLLLLALALTGGLLRYKQQEKNQLLLWEKTTRNFLAINSDRRDLLAFQVENMLPGMWSDYQKLNNALQEAFRTGAWEKSASLVPKLSALLTSGAEKLLPAIPDKNGDFQKDFAVIGRARGFMLSPLYAYLPSVKQKVFKKHLSRFESHHYNEWAGPRCNREWNHFQNFNYAMVFLPPGVVKMDHNGKKVQIPYHFWMAKNEVPASFFTRMTGIAPQYSPHPGTPVDRVVWNDVLLYCYALTHTLKNNNYLPPGYIVRPPTEPEWEYAAKNAYLWKEDLPFDQRVVYSKNSGRRSWPSGSKIPSKLGINDIFGNLFEIVLNTEKTKMKHSVVIRGGSFLSTEKNINRRVELQKYQNIPYDIGFRVVIAPGDMSYYDKHFFLGGSNMLRSHGRVFELLGENVGSFTWKSAEEHCRLLGGRLAEPDSPDLLKKITEEMPLAAAGWVCFLGGKRVKDKWVWLSSGKEITNGKWGRKNKLRGDFLTLKRKTWNPETTCRSAIFICQWDEKEFPTRNKQLESNKPLPLELLRFSVGSRRFMLIDSHMAWYTARRFCELLGGRLACLDTPEIRQEVIKKLDKFSSKRILLGGYAKRQHWFWLSGKKISFQLREDKDFHLPTVNRNFVTLKNGRFYNSQNSDLVLCEWAGN